LDQNAGGEKEEELYNTRLNIEQVNVGEINNCVVTVRESLATTAGVAGSIDNINDAAGNNAAEPVCLSNRLQDIGN